MVEHRLFQSIFARSFAFRQDSWGAWSDEGRDFDVVGAGATSLCAEGRWRGGWFSALLQQVLAMTPEQMDRLTPVQRTQVEQLRAAAMSQGRM